MFQNEHEFPLSVHQVSLKERVAAVAMVALGFLNKLFLVTHVLRVLCEGALDELLHPI